jgi:hypothetical protein
MSRLGSPPTPMYRRERLLAALEHVPKKLLDFFDSDMLQVFDFELRPYRSNDSI